MYPASSHFLHYFLAYYLYYNVPLCCYTVLSRKSMGSFITRTVNALTPDFSTELVLCSQCYFVSIKYSKITTMRSTMQMLVRHQKLHLLADTCLRL